MKIKIKTKANCKIQFIILIIPLFLLVGCSGQEELEDTSLILTDASSMLPTREQIPSEWVGQPPRPGETVNGFVRFGEAEKGSQFLKSTSITFYVNKFTTLEEADRYYSEEVTRFKNGADFSEEFPLSVKNSACFGYERLPVTRSDTNQIEYLGLGICIKKNIVFIVQAISSETKDVKSLVKKFIKIAAKNIQ